MINKGDVIRNADGIDTLVTSVLRGRHGWLIKGQRHDGVSEQSFEIYVLPELPVSSNGRWYGWSREFIALSGGAKLGALSLYRDDPRNTIEEYDLEFERTIEAIRKEEVTACTK
tara:strand:+ start:503 stop:844 length:342 start_codon:yes stop_codon:yes gene_type:complete